MAKNKWFIPFLVILGLAFVGLSLFLSTRSDNRSLGLKKLARLMYTSGDVAVFRKNMTDKELIKKNTDLYYLDSVEIGPDGDAVLEFDSSYRIRILDNALVTLDEEEGRANIILKRGDVQVENFGRENSVIITKNGQRYSATDYELTFKRENANQNFPEIAPDANLNPTPAPGADGSLSAEYIQDTLKRQIPAFDKCYKQVLQRTPGLTGQVVMNFTIDRNGKIVSASVGNSSINDNDFKRCLSEVLMRTEFKSFTGDPITSSFPITFE